MIEHKRNSSDLRGNKAPVRRKSSLPKSKKDAIKRINASTSETFKPIAKVDLKGVVDQKPISLNGSTKLESCSTTDSKEDRFMAILKQKDVDIEKLKQLSWSGIPGKLRPIVWKLLTVGNVSEDMY